MSIRLCLCLTALSASLLFGASAKHQAVQDAWLSSIGKVKIVEADAGESWLVIKGNHQHKFPTWGFLRACFREFGRSGGELFLIQLNAADSAWFHILEVRSNGSFFLSPMFGNGGDLPTIKNHGESLEVEFEALDLPRGKVEGQSWRYEAHNLKKLR